MKQNSLDTVVVNPDFIIKPVEGFGSHEMIRQTLITERPDAVLLITDPRQFIFIWEIEDEIHQICPITYWHVWDNDPYPAFNKVWYDSTDLINCLSYKTYEMVKEHFPEKTNYIPHTFPNDMYHKLPDNIIAQMKQQHFGDKKDWFYGLWVNRNATRKMPNDVLNAWKVFLDNLEKEEGHRKAVLIMHTDPADQEGPNLFVTVDMLGIKNNVWFSTDKLEFRDMNIMHNIVDFVVNISKAEGFGLTVHSSLKVGKPVIVSHTGGHIRQAVNHKTGEEYGVSIKPAARTMVGSQLVPYIFDDHVSHLDVADAYMKLYKMPKQERDKIGEDATKYMNEEFAYKDMISEWDRTLENCVKNWKVNKKTRKDWVLSKLQSNTIAMELPPTNSVQTRQIVSGPQLINVPEVKAVRNAEPRSRKAMK